MGRQHITYKVWAHIEAYNEATGNGEDIDLPEELAEFDTAEEAQDFVCKLSEVEP